jgi:sialate O-acetylesterase
MTKADPKQWYQPPLGHSDTPTDIYNSVIHPIVPETLTGVLWYQGEQDGFLEANYKGYLEALIQGWRDEFSAPALPFIVIQLPGFGGDYCQGFPGVRIGQEAAVQETANTALVATIDTGDPKTIHPPAKAEVGRRASLAALALANHARVHWQAPTVKSSFVLPDGSIRLRFDTGRKSLVSLDGQPLRAFEVSADGSNWKPANATLFPSDRSILVVKGQDVDHPTAVRYAAAPWPAANLGTDDHLAAAPFTRTVYLESK